jgi:hypothetical protein
MLTEQDRTAANRYSIQSTCSGEEEMDYFRQQCVHRDRVRLTAVSLSIVLLDLERGSSTNGRQKYEPRDL